MKSICMSCVSKKECSNPAKGKVEICELYANKTSVKMNAKRNKCVLCGNEFVGYGNNPEPLNSKGECCDLCNSTKVIPARIALSKRGN